MRRTVLAVAVALVVAACGGTSDGAADITSSAPAEETSAPASSVAPDGNGDAETPSESAAPAESTDEGTETATPSFDGPPAPDFEVVLADGTPFSLSAEQKPVYMVFWAEW